MTDRGPHPWITAAAALAVFSLLLALLVTRVRAGEDPALPKPQAAAAPAPPRRVLVRRIERRVIVTRVREIEPAAAASTPVATPAPTVHVSAAPPVVVAAPAPAPAPVPAPAAPVSRSS
jgi:hypothetical protein